ncbi:flagellar basal body L-ring protein FlgH [Sphingomonas morindae]|uniref:Flagellar L-ring protein n=1 Tax=Sphingomonas morindae TaxID=1541170 RepID=A0ABY4X9U9_9SPHN|nr:flagellar basal body L-ring protein FlgH [Sphingomonas morindae]USI73741.1 flagellar basal body L-ring protein FlgH [Sphingomonas morindae]
MASVRLLCVLGLGLALAAPAEARRAAPKVSEYAPTMPQPLPAPPANGAIFQVSLGYAPLTSGARASMVGDLVTIVLTERTAAQKTNTASTDRSGNAGLTPPTSGPLSFFKASDASAGASATFSGKGGATQSNQLTGAVTVTVQQVLPNGNLVVRGEKHLTLNRGDEFVQISGIIRPVDIDSQNQVLSTRVADARITYSGKGEIARASSQGWLGRFFSRVSPF